MTTSSMRGVRKNEMTPKQRKILCNLTIEYLDKLGAEKVRQYTSPGIEGILSERTYYDYRLETPAGPMDVSFSDSDIHLHCRFHDRERASEKFNMDMRTGKYNEYAFGRFTGQHAFDGVFKPHLDRALRA